MAGPPQSGWRFSRGQVPHSTDLGRTVRRAEPASGVVAVYIAVVIAAFSLTEPVVPEVNSGAVFDTATE